MRKIPELRSVGGLVVNSQKHILCVEEFGEYWGLPRGHVEECEDDLATVTREIYEESGIKDLTYLCHLGEYSRSTFDKDGIPNYKEIKHLNYYCFKTMALELKPIDVDVTNAAWLSVPDAKKRLINQDDINFFEQSIKIITDIGLIDGKDK